MGNLSFTKLVVSVQCGVKWEGNIGAGAQISFVTVGLSGAKSSNTVQSVILSIRSVIACLEAGLVQDLSARR